MVDGDELTFPNVALETESGSSILKCAKGLGNRGQRAADHSVVKMKNRIVQWITRAAILSFCGKLFDE